MPEAGVIDGAELIEGLRQQRKDFYEDQAEPLEDLYEQDPILTIQCLQSGQIQEALERYRQAYFRNQQEAIQKLYRSLHDWDPVNPTAGFKRSAGGNQAAQFVDQAAAVLRIRGLQQRWIGARPAGAAPEAPGPTRSRSSSPIRNIGLGGSGYRERPASPMKRTLQERRQGEPQPAKRRKIGHTPPNSLEYAKNIIAAIYWDINCFCRLQDSVREAIISGNDAPLDGKGVRYIEAAEHFIDSFISQQEDTVQEMESFELCQAFITRLGWKMLAICAHSEAFRLACEADETMGNRSLCWTHLVRLIKENRRSLEVFARTRRLPWRDVLLKHANNASIDQDPPHSEGSQGSPPPPDSVNTPSDLSEESFSESEESTSLGEAYRYDPELYEVPGAQIRRWIDDPDEPDCDVLPSTLTFARVRQDSKLELVRRNIRVMLREAFDAVGLPNEWVNPVPRGNSVYRCIEIDNSDIGMFCTAWIGPSVFHIDQMHNPARNRSVPLEEDRPPMSQIIQVMYEKFFPISSLRYIFVTEVVNAGTFNFIKRTLYPENDLEWPSRMLRRYIPSTWAFGTPEYDALLATPIGRTISYLVLGAYPRGTHRIVRVVTWPCSPIAVHMRFDIEALNETTEPAIEVASAGDVDDWDFVGGDSAQGKNKALAFLRPALGPEIYLANEHHHHIVHSLDGSLKRPRFNGQFQKHINHHIWRPEDFDNVANPALVIAPWTCNSCRNMTTHEWYKEIKEKDRKSDDDCDCVCRIFAGDLVELREYQGKGTGVRVLATYPHEESGMHMDTYTGVIQVKGMPNCAHDRYYLDLCPDVPGPDKGIICPTYYGNWTRFINHSCDSKAEFLAAAVGGRWVVFVHLQKEISIFEELTVNYGGAYFKNVEYPCLCGSPQCFSKLGFLKGEGGEGSSKGSGKIVLKYGNPI